MNYLVMFFTRLQSAIRYRYTNIVTPYTYECEQIVKLLWRYNLIGFPFCVVYKRYGGRISYIHFSLRVNGVGEQCIRKIKLVSKPSNRVFWTSEQIKDWYRLQIQYRECFNRAYLIFRLKNNMYMVTDKVLHLRAGGEPLVMLWI